VFDNEIAWFARSIEVLADRLDLSRFTKPGYYPVLGELSGGGGLAWEVRISDRDVKTLCLCRFNAKRSTANDVTFPRYYYRSRRGRYSQQVPVSTRFVEDGGLREFSESLNEVLGEIRGELLDTLPPGLTTPDAEDLFQQVVLDGRPCVPTDTTLASGVVLDAPLPRIALLACESPQSATDLAAQFPLTAEKITQLLGYTLRYDPDVLAAGLLFIPRLEREKSLYQAISDRDTYRADPLLTALDSNFEAPGDDEALEWLSARQCKGRAFDKAIDSGRAVDAFATTWGRAPYPDEDEAQKTRLQYAPHASVRRYRWRILQLLWRGVAEAANFPGGLVGDPVLEQQRLALLRGDVSSHFDDGAAGDIPTMIDNCIARMRTAGSCEPRVVNERDDLPQSGE